MFPILWIFKKLEYNYFAMLCQFLLYNKVNQLYVYIHSLPLEPPSHPSPIYPSRSSESTELPSSIFFFFFFDNRISINRKSKLFFFHVDHFVFPLQCVSQIQMQENITCVIFKVKTHKTPDKPSTHACFCRLISPQLFNRMCLVSAPTFCQDSHL